MAKLTIVDVQRLVDGAWSGNDAPRVLAVDTHCRLAHASGKYVDLSVTRADLEQAGAEFIASYLAPAIAMLKSELPT